MADAIARPRSGIPDVLARWGRRIVAWWISLVPAEPRPRELRSEAVRTRRLQLGISQDELGRAAHVSRSVISGIETGGRQSLFAMRRVARTLTRLELERWVREGSDG